MCEANQKARSVKISYFLIFDANLRFVLLASLRSAVLSEIKVVTELDPFSSRVNLII
jgi:hypothetical protein